MDRKFQELIKVFLRKVADLNLKLNIFSVVFFLSKIFVIILATKDKRTRKL